MDKRKRELKKLMVLRKQIDQVDYELLHGLSIRLKIVRKIARIKRELSLPVFQKNRWEEMLKKRIRLAEQRYHLDSKFSLKFFALIHQEAVRLQRSLRKRSKR
jgi:chorismate mutase